MSPFIDTLHLTSEHGYCLAATLLILPVNVYAIHHVHAKRKLYNVKYPAVKNTFINIKHNNIIFNIYM